MNRRASWVVLGAAVLLVGVFGKNLGLDQPDLLASAGSDASQATDVTLRALSIVGEDGPSTVVGNGGWVVLGSDWSWRSSLLHPDFRFSLERRIGEAGWAPIDAVVSWQRKDGLQVRTPAWSTDEARTVVQYRVVSHAFGDPDEGGVAMTTRSSPVRVTYENQAFYTGVAATVYADAEAYCPSTAVHVVDLGDDTAGMYGTGSQLLRIDDTVGVSTERLPIDVRAIALHECSHERQWMNYGGTWEGDDEVQRDAAKLFTRFKKPAGVTTPYEYWLPKDKVDPIEHAADCGAQALNPGGYLGYGGWCSKTQLAEGRTLLLGGTY